MFPLFTGIRWNLPFSISFPLSVNRPSLQLVPPTSTPKPYFSMFSPCPQHLIVFSPVRRRLFSFFFVLIIGQIHTVEQLHILALFCHICSSLYLSNLHAPQYSLISTHTPGCCHISLRDTGILIPVLRLPDVACDDCSNRTQINFLRSASDMLPTSILSPLIFQIEPPH